MQREGVDELFLLDGDVLTFANYSAEICPALPAGSIAGLMTLEDQDAFALATSMHVSYWTHRALADFTAFCARAYETPAVRARLEAKYRRRVARHEAGGVCEMTLLHLWRARNRPQVCNLAHVTAGNATTIDLAMSTPDNAYADEYAVRSGVKRIRFVVAPHGFDRRLQTRVRFLALHCQGHSKPLMSLLRMPGVHPFPPPDRRHQADHRKCAAGRAKALRHAPPRR